MKQENYHRKVNGHKVIAVAGPTASGKTSFALKLAEPDLHEIINVDSMQIYKEIEIGNNKEGLISAQPQIKPQSQAQSQPQIKPQPQAQSQVQFKPQSLEISIAEFAIGKNQIPAHLFSIISVTEQISVQEFQCQARQKISEIHLRGKVPILVGGSGLYLSAVLFDYDFAEFDDRDIKMRKRQLGEDVVKLQQILISQSFDLKTLNNSDLNNPRRLQNLIIKAESIGATQNHSESKKKTSAKYDCDLHIMEINLSQHRQKLKARVKEMLENGFIEECVKLLQDFGYENISDQVKNASGYRQVFEYLLRKGDSNGIADLSTTQLQDLESKIVTSHYQLAKKQLTWQRKYL